MSRVHVLKQQRATKVQEMRGLLDLAEREKRDLNDGEQGRFDSLKGEVVSIETRIGQAETVEEMERRAEGTLLNPEGQPETRSWGVQAIEAPELRAFVSGGYRGTARIELRAVTNLGAIVAPDRQATIIGLPRRRLVVRDLLPQVPTTSSSIEYIRESSFTNNAAPVLEATGAAGVGVKPESDLALALYNAPVRVIAHWLTVSRQAMDDLAQLRAFIDNRLRWGLAYVEEIQLLSGNGTSPNLAGLIGAATAYETARNVAGDKRVDVVHHAIAQLADAGISATGIVMNLADWSKLVEQKDTTGQYLSQGPFGTIDQPRLWGLPVAGTPAMSAGSFLVGDFQSAATIYDRMAPEVLISSEHSDYFVRNLLAVRAEERVGLAIPMPAALVTGTFGTVTA